MENELLYENLCEDSCINLIFRICAIHFQFSSVRSYDLNVKKFITTENTLWPKTWLMTRYHLTWRKISTSFISIFDRYWKALDWAQMLKQKECVDIHIEEKIVQRTSDCHKFRIFKRSSSISRARISFLRVHWARVYFCNTASKGASNPYLGAHGHAYVATVTLWGNRITGLKCSKKLSPRRDPSAVW